MPVDDSKSKPLLIDSYLSSLDALKSFIEILSDQRNEVNRHQLSVILYIIYLSFDNLSDPLEDRLSLSLSEQGCGAREKAQA